MQPPDTLLSIIKAHRDDARASRIDVGVGVYRSDTGETAALRCVAMAEQRLVHGQSTKSYLGPKGDQARSSPAAPFSVITQGSAIGKRDRAEALRRRTNRIVDTLSAIPDQVA